MVYEKDTVCLMGMQARGSALIPLRVLEQRLADWIDLSLTDQQRICAALINDSFFVPHPEAQFILRIFAIEALCAQPPTQGKRKRSSPRQICKSKFRTLRLTSEAKAFDALYDLRCDFVHEGKGRGKLVEANNTALQLATDLLEADLRQSRRRGLYHSR